MYGVQHQPGSYLQTIFSRRADILNGCNILPYSLTHLRVGNITQRTSQQILAHGWQGTGSRRHTRHAETRALNHSITIFLDERRDTHLGNSLRCPCSDFPKIAATVFGGVRNPESAEQLSSLQGRLTIPLMEISIRQPARAAMMGDLQTCAVLVNGKLVNSCLVPLGQMEQAEITTVEGKSMPQSPSPVW